MWLLGTKWLFEPSDFMGSSGSMGPSGFMGPSTNTKSLAKEFPRILIFEYFGYLEIGSDVFFDVDSDSESPRMT